MVALNLKAETLALIDRRSSIESEMNAIIATLCSPGGPGLSGNLVDSEGFPRSDINVHAIRTQRNRLTVLRTDHKDITAKIDENLQVLHSAKLTKGGPVANQSRVGAAIEGGSSLASPIVEDPVMRIPFAMIDDITDGSPAAQDGLQLHDEIVKFGSVEGGDELVPKLAREALSNQGTPISVAILRQGSLMNLTVTPRQWHGRGLLGCHFRIIH